MVYVGIDPGKKGGFATIDTESGETRVYLWDDKAFVDEMKRRFIQGDEIRCCVEKVSAMPGNGAVSMFRFGQSLGYIIGVLTAYEVPFQLVPPKVWKKEFSLDNDKQKSIAACQRLYPNVNLIPKGCRKPSDGEAESLLIATYAKRHF